MRQMVARVILRAFYQLGQPADGTSSNAASACASSRVDDPAEVCGQYTTLLPVTDRLSGTEHPASLAPSDASRTGRGCSLSALRDVASPYSSIF